MLGLFFVIIFCELPEPWHRNKTKAKIGQFPFLAGLKSFVKILRAETSHDGEL
jgi:hypothetical protein